MSVRDTRLQLFMKVCRLNSSTAVFLFASLESLHLLNLKAHPCVVTPTVTESIESVTSAGLQHRHRTR